MAERLYVRKYFFPAICFVLAGFLLGWHIYSAHGTNGAVALAQRRYPLLSKYVATVEPQNARLNFMQLHRQLQQYLDSTGANYSFYFEYLPNNASIKLGQKQEIIAASLMKLPWVMNMYRASEMGKLNLDKQMTIKPEWVDNRYGEDAALQAGKAITLRQAGDKALQESNNTAILMVQNTVRDALPIPDRVWNATDVPYTATDDIATLTISAENYSSFLKCLYYACYLSRESSQTVLDSLAHSDTNTRLPAGLPTGTKVAHKLGTYDNRASSDCGIVYYANRNYVFCMMIDLPETEADSAIAKTSKIVYNFVSSAKP